MNSGRQQLVLAALLPLGGVWGLHMSSPSQSSRDCTRGGCSINQVSGRYSHCAAVFSSRAGNHMIVYGGQGFVSGSSALTTLGDAWSFDMYNTDWTLLQQVTQSTQRASRGSLPAPRSSHACALAHENEEAGTADLLVFGGLALRDLGGGSDVVNELWKLALVDERVTGAGNLVRGQWMRLEMSGARPVPRFDHTLTMHQGSLLLYGGCAGASAYDDIWRLNYSSSTGTQQQTWVALTADATGDRPMPPASPAPPLGVADVTPGDRCAHAAVPHASGLLAMGGRVPWVPPGGSQGNPTWVSMSDAWVFDVAAAAAGGGRGGWTEMPLVARTANGLLPVLDSNRSDHTALVHDGNLLVFGGLFTNVVENTIYIMKDWLSFKLPASPQQPSELTQLSWGPDWRFDHTMVLAPSIAHPARSGSLNNAPLLYGGGGGREIFGDMWVYDEGADAWYELSWAPMPDAVFSVLTSMLFGTVGFGIYACIIVCVIFRRLVQTSGGRPGARLGGGFGDQIGNARALHSPRRGVDPARICAMPRVRWGDVVKLHPPPVAEASAGGSADEAGEAEEEVCAVCLSGYEADDMLLRLPCEHLFHEDCVGRWLQNDCTCPQCRYNLNRPSPQALAHAAVRREGSSHQLDEEAGTELSGQALYRGGGGGAGEASPVITDALPGAEVDASSAAAPNAASQSASAGEPPQLRPEWSA